MTGPLDGVRVLDFGQYIAGPVTAMLLADQGADVLRIDPPGGPSWDTPANAAWNRGKRRVVLDLKQPHDHDAALRLIASADVLVENFRPGVMERLGLGPAASAEVNPGLVYCSLPGFASDDPRAEVAAWEGVVAAATDTYRPPREGDGPPVYTAIPIASMFAAFTAANSIAAALVWRARHGAGQRIEVPLFDAMFGAIGGHGLRAQGAAGGLRPNDFGAGVYECADGEWVQIALAKPHFIQHLVQATRLADEFDVAQLRVDAEARASLMAELPALFREKTADEWEQIGVRADLPLIRARTSREWIETLHTLESQTMVPIDDPTYGRMWQPNSPLRVGRDPAPPAVPAPALDADREAVTTEAGVASVQAAGSMATGGGALEGLRVLDLSLVLAGPVGGRTLAEYGADVIKINPPTEEGAGIWFSRHRYHTDVNRGKRSVLLDLKTPEGLEAFWQLVDQADVVIHNFRPGVVERLGIDFGTARKRNPTIIYAAVGSYGEPGPWSKLPAYEPFGQAATGMSRRQGGQGRPLGQPFAVNDYGTGLLSALAILLALYERERTGEGQHVAAALAYTGTFLQLPHMIEYPGKEWAEPSGPAALGASAFQRLYEASDGWFFMGARRSQVGVLGEALGIDITGDHDEANLAEALAERFARDSVDAWCGRLVELGIGAHRLVSLDELMADPWVQAHGLSVTRTHDTGEEVTTTGPAPRMSLSPVVPGVPAPTPGADTAAVLESIPNARAV